jgi:Zn-dependent M28 family amino/carboxypeptidase
MRRRRLVWPTVGALLLASLLPASVRPDPAPPGAVRQQTVQEALRGIQAGRIRAHLAFLADDMLEGRAPGTRGAGIAARYIAAQLARAGVEPIRGSYFQNVPLLGWRPDPSRVRADFTRGAAALTLDYPDDAVLWLESGADSAAATGELVFVGYGTRAPEYQWDDFKGRDVRGRILLVLSSDPPAPPGQPLVFDGPALSWYGRYTYKIEEAARRGAAGIVIVHTPEGAGYDWDVVESSWTGEQLALPADTLRATSPLQLQGWLTFDAARRVLDLAELDLNELFVRAARPDFQPVFTGIAASLRAGGTARRFSGTNVVGMVAGSHATRTGEVVVYTAHYDHLGIGPPVNGDSIYNGAYDNASGVALLLEIAEAFASLADRPDRSVLFLFPTAEEAGMLGSSWYVRQPLVPIDRTVAALNIDGANIWGETEDVSAVGLERSTLGVTFERQAAALGLRVEGERAPGLGFFFRSDHFPFARAGVPALFIDHGTTFRGRPGAWGDSVLADYKTRRYHRPQDAYDRSFNLAGAVQQGRHAFLVGHNVANAPARPRWYEGRRP